MKQPQEIVDDYGKEIEGIVVSSARLLPEGVKEQGERSCICGLETEEVKVMRWLCGP